MESSNTLHPVMEANPSSIFGPLTQDEFYKHHSVSHGSEYMTNTKGNLQLFTQWWTPISQPIKGVVCMVHGYTGESSWFFQLTAVHIAKNGFAVCAIDHMGHGYSEGVVIRIHDYNVVLDDCVSFFNAFRARYEPGLPGFLYAESLGGAMALLITLRKEGVLPVKKFDGVVLNGAICVVDESVQLPWEIDHFLTRKSFQEGWKRKLAMACPRRPLMKPDEATSKELLRMCRDLRAKLKEIDTPFTFVHGGADKVCDLDMMMEVYNQAATEDKGYQMSAGGWHQLVGEYNDFFIIPTFDMLIVQWLCERAKRSGMSAVSGSATAAEVEGIATALDESCSIA